MPLTEPSWQTLRIQASVGYFMHLTIILLLHVYAGYSLHLLIQ